MRKAPRGGPSAYRARHELPLDGGRGSETIPRPCVEQRQRFGAEPEGPFVRATREPVKKGMDVSLVPYATHRDARFFPDPLRFDPERFLGEREKSIDRYAWIPFGGGPRVCVGNAFAMMETTLVLATVASRFRLHLTEGLGLVPVPGVTLRPKGPVRMRLQKR